ncbi:hypothetical protein ACWT_5814 [Actinoplanes sp. SE50]|nr:MULTISPECIES: hypothetical protein [unclassified Actinoplanes]AEV86832.1 hypothetical protein ACPL_5945 [Actinoplanes sp. SE50/110]ATO85229.1 hypothetical protein ACWT_5814 [Actinoplanes sp. SE50]SLM02639.1 hypothetical protein ACSP50_5921 [Actinoplanes sp. SE50/110]
MTPTGFLAEAGLAFARQARPARLDPLREQLRQLQVDLLQARTAVAGIGENLERAVTAADRTGVVPPWLVDAVAVCRRRLDALDAVVERVDGRLP